jgi:hypothetical protein
MKPAHAANMQLMLNLSKFNNRKTNPQVFPAINNGILDEPRKKETDCWRKQTKRDFHQANLCDISGRVGSGRRCNRHREGLYRQGPSKCANEAAATAGTKKPAIFRLRASYLRFP